MKNDYDAKEWFDNCKAVKNVISRFFSQPEVDGNFCDHVGGIFGFWKEYRGHEFYVKSDPCYFGYYTIFVKGVKTSFDGTPYFEAGLTSDQILSVENGLSILSDMWNEFSPTYKTATDLYCKMIEATFETCHTCDEMDDKTPEVAKMSEACQKSGEHTGCFVMQWRQAISNAKKSLCLDKKKVADEGRFVVIKASNVVDKPVISSTTEYRTNDLADAMKWIKKDCDTLASTKNGSVRTIDSDGRETILSYFVGEKKYNTVWRVVEFPDGSIGKML